MHGPFSKILGARPPGSTPLGRCKLLQLGPRRSHDRQKLWCILGFVPLSSAAVLLCKTVCHKFGISLVVGAKRHFFPRGFGVVGAGAPLAPAVPKPL